VFGVDWNASRCSRLARSRSSVCGKVTQYAVSRRMLGPEIEGEVAQGGFGHNGLASAAGSTLATDAGSRSIGFQFHRVDVIDAARTGRASGTSMLLSLLESREYVASEFVGHADRVYPHSGRA